MRALLTAMIALGICCALAFADDAQAKKRKQKQAAALNVVVVPFVGKGAGGSEVKEALELELELLAVAQVSASDSVEADVRKAGKQAFESGPLSTCLKRRAVDVLIRGERGPGEKSADALVVIAYGRDGQPRFYRELALGSEPDATAATIVDALRPTLQGWRNARPVRIPSGRGAQDRLGVLFIDESLLGEPSERPPVVGRAQPGALVRDVDESAAAPKRKPSRFDDELKPMARSEVRQDGRRHTLDDIEDDIDAPAGEQKLAHTFALSGAFDGATWRYDGVGDAEVAAGFYPGGSVLVDVWPFAWLGADTEVAFGAVRFQFKDAQPPVTPAEFLSLQTRVGAAVKLRYPTDNGFGFGARIGYRYFGATVEPQTVVDGAQPKNLTIVPGYALHALAVGAEIFVPILIGGSSRLEVEARAEGLPGLTHYAEEPDNPGDKSLAFGWAVSVAARYDLLKGFFLEARGQSTGAMVSYTEQGDRVAFVDGSLTTLKGGSVLNLTAGFSAGIGFMF